METTTKTAIVKQGSALADALLKLALAKGQADMLKTAIETLKERVRSLGGNAEAYTLPDGTPLATDKEQAGKLGVDLDLLAKDYPPAYSACVSQGAPFSVLSLKKGIIHLDPLKLKVKA